MMLKLIILIHAFIVTSAFIPVNLPFSTQIDLEAKAHISQRTGYHHCSTSTSTSKSFSPRSTISRGVILNAIADKSESKASSSPESKEENDAKVTGRKRIFSWGVDKIPILFKKTKSKDVSSAVSGESLSPPLPIKKKSKKPRRNPLIHHVESLGQYKEVVADEKDKIVVVRFYAEWCKACKAIKPAYNRLAKLYHLQNQNREQQVGVPLIKFVEVPLTKENAVLHQGLGIPSLPYGHIYCPDVGLVEERKIAKSKFKVFEQVLQSYVEGSCHCDFLEDDNNVLQIVQSNPKNTISNN